MTSKKENQKDQEKKGKPRGDKHPLVKPKTSLLSAVASRMIDSDDKTSEKKSKKKG